MYVNTNVSALNAQRQLLGSGIGMSKAFERLSSGFRINSAADDAAGLQISNRLTSQVGGLNQAIQNANDGISVAQVAEGAMDEITNALQRMRVLSVQAENGINSLEDRNALQKEVLALQKEIDRIANTTEFGGQKLLDGNYKSSFLVGANAGQKIDIDLTQFGAMDTADLWVSEVDVINTESQSDGERGYIGSEYFALGAKRFYADGSQLGVVSSMPGPIQTVEGLSVKIGDGEFIKIPTFTAPIGGATEFINAIHSATGMNFLQTAPSPPFINILVNQDIELQFAMEGLSPDEFTRDNKMASITSITGLYGFHLGDLPYGNTDYNTSLIDRAIEKVDTARAYLGAQQNRFQSTIRNLSNVVENVSAARSRIRDTDFAKETAELTRSQILQQAATTVLGQANQRPQSALNLLG